MIENLNLYNILGLVQIIIYFYPCDKYYIIYPHFPTNIINVTITLSVFNAITPKLLN